MEGNQYGLERQQCEQPISVGEWMLTMFIVGIPVIGFIMTLIWAFKKDGNTTKSNFFKAALVWMVISIVVCAIFGGAIFSMAANIMV